MIPITTSLDRVPRVSPFSSLECLESLRVVVDAKEVKRVIIVPAEEEYGDKVPAILNKVDGKEKMTVFGMNPPTSEVAYQWEMFGFAVLQSLGIKADEL